MKSFGSTEFTRCLKRLGFAPEPQVGSRHRKYTCPKKHVPSERPFLIVLQGKSEYDRVTQSKIMSSMKKHGFSIQEIDTAMWGK